MQEPTTLKRQAAAYVMACGAVAEAIRDLGEIPSGELYARLMGHMSLQTYDRIIGSLVRAELVTNSCHLLKWVGPAK